MDAENLWKFLAESWNIHMEMTGKITVRLLDHHHFHETIRRCHDEVTRVFCELHFSGSVLEEYPLFTIIFSFAALTMVLLLQKTP